MAKRSSASSDKDFSLAGVCACVWMRSLSPIPIKRPEESAPLVLEALDQSLDTDPS